MAAFLDFAKEYSDGWCLIAVRAPMESVATAVAAAPGVKDYQPNAKISTSFKDAGGVGCDGEGNYLSLTPSKTERTCYVVSIPKSAWRIIFRTIGWCEIEDAHWAEPSARRLSQELSCSTLASCGGGHGLLTQLFESGTLESEFDVYDRKKVAAQFKSLKIPVPMCFIAGDPPLLFVDEPELPRIERADRFVVQVG